VESALVGGELVAGDVSVCAGVVEAVGLPPAPGASGVAVPGFLDWQVNGFAGVHFTDADASGFATAEYALACAGIVLALPTVLNTSVDGYLGALDELAHYRASVPDSGLLGAHLEGPFLSPRWHGAHDEGSFHHGTPDLLTALLGSGEVSMLTLAPEQPGVEALIPALVDAGVVVSIGHSDATVQQCAAAQKLGASAVTHCWNAHRRFAPRDPGPAGWALSRQGVTVGLIADGIHVAPEVLALTFAAAPHRVALTTDAIAPAVPGSDGPGPTVGAPMRGVVVRDGAARLADGTLAGSVATPSDMLRVLDAAGVDFPSAVRALHAPQAEALGLQPWSLLPGDPAHVVVLDDAMEVCQAWRHGRRLV